MLAHDGRLCTSHQVQQAQVYAACWQSRCCTTALVYTVVTRIITAGCWLPDKQATWHVQVARQGNCVAVHSQALQTFRLLAIMVVSCELLGDDPLICSDPHLKLRLSFSNVLSQRAQVCSWLLLRPCAVCRAGREFGHAVHIALKRSANARKQRSLLCLRRV
jgi:hypothetical protein